MPVTDDEGVGPKSADGCGQIPRLLSGMLWGDWREFGGPQGDGGRASGKSNIEQALAQALASKRLLMVCCAWRSEPGKPRSINKGELRYELFQWQLEPR